MLTWVHLVVLLALVMLALALGEELGMALVHLARLGRQRLDRWRQSRSPKVFPRISAAKLYSATSRTLARWRRDIFTPSG
jgi:hypothetical protein